MNPRLVQALALALCASLLYAATLITPAINTGRARLAAYTSERPEQNAPPEYAFFIQAFGAFRGIITNILFIRAEQFKEQGRYYDAMQLAEWICTVQPRFPSVWEFHSWNMAWNISVTTYTPEERFNWVYNGVKLIRDRGIVYNPRAINLYRQIAWIFVNKMSENTDEYHMTYKRFWAWRMHLVLGSPPDPLRENRQGEPVVLDFKNIGEDPLARSVRRWKLRKQGLPIPPELQEDAAAPAAPKAVAQPDASLIARKETYDYLKSIADAPRTLEQLYAAAPAAREIVSRLRALGCLISDDKLTEDNYWHDGGLAATFFMRYRKLAERPALLAKIRKQAEPGSGAAPESDLAEFERIMGVADKNPDGQALLRFLQRKTLVEVYKLDPAKMAEIVELFGPIDWRVVDGHSLYWINEALIRGEETLSTIRNDKTNTTRLIFFSLRNLHNRNRLVFEPLYDSLTQVNNAYLSFAPDLNFIEAMHQAYLTYGPNIDPEPGPGAGATFRVGHENFLTESIRSLYFFDRVGEAAKYYEYLRTIYGRNAQGEIKQAYLKPLVDFVMDSFYETELGYRETISTINGYLFRSFDFLASGDAKAYAASIRQAQLMHERYHGEGEIAEKSRLPEFSNMAVDALEAWLMQPSPGSARTLEKARLWAAMQPDLTVQVYDSVAELLKGECELAEFDFEKAFPAPPGLEEWRKANPTRAKKKEESPIETPAQQIR